MVPIPLPSTIKFTNGIYHPELYLWDGWSYVDGGNIHLYCLAISRTKEDGSVLEPMERNDFPFHIRHFLSVDEGQTWEDRGCFLSPEMLPKELNYRTIWSGSIEPMANGDKLVAYTGISMGDDTHLFIQNIALGVSVDGYTVNELDNTHLSSPFRDWEAITDKGFYLDKKESLGNKNGEGDGPIKAWRDPFIFVDKADEINLFWAAKSAPRDSLLCRATIVKNAGGKFEIDTLYPPIAMPDIAEYTQFELPKVYFDAESETYYLLASTCNRIYEGQPDSEVDKCIRLYKSRELNGSWENIGDRLQNAPDYFGLTVLKTDFANNRLICISPITDAVEDDKKKLTFTPVFAIDLDTGVCSEL